MFNLFTYRKFTPLFLTQFGGAFNDNLYKNAFAVLLVYTLAPAHGYNASILVNVTQVIFILPFILFAAIAGLLGDFYDKAYIMRRVKLLEILIVLCALLALYLESVPLLMLIVFLLTTQSTFFGPVKYAILPQQLPEQLVPANALISAGTFLAIIGGTLLGSYYASIDAIGALSVSLLVIAIAGFLTAQFVPAAPPAAAKAKLNFNPFTATARLLGYFFKQRRDFVPLFLGISWFWFVGSVLITQIPVMTGEYLALEARSVSLFLLMFAGGVALGSLVISWLLKGQATNRLASFTVFLLGALILGTSFALGGAAENLTPNAGEEYVSLVSFFSNWRALLLCAGFTLTSVVGGCYVLPIFALIQRLADPEERSQVVAANSFINALFMVISAIIVIIIYAAGGDVALVFQFLGVACLVVAVLWRYTKPRTK